MIVFPSLYCVGCFMDMQALMACDSAGGWLHTMVLILGGVSSLIGIVVGIRKLLRWWRPPPVPWQGRAAARALRAEGNRFFDAGHVDSAIALYTVSIALNDRSGETYYRRAEAHAKLGNTNLAAKDVSAALTRLPQYDRAQRLHQQLARPPVPAE
jgi:hypothetical protein